MAEDERRVQSHAGICQTGADGTGINAGTKRVQRSHRWIDRATGKMQMLGELEAVGYMKMNLRLPGKSDHWSPLHSVYSLLQAVFRPERKQLCLLPAVVMVKLQCRHIFAIREQL